MNSSLRTSATGMIAQQRMIDVIADNLANVNTTGFKRSRVSFEDMLYETLQGTRIVNQPGAENVGPVQVGKGVRVAAILRQHGQGAVEQTGRPLDLSIEGDGFLQVRRPDGNTAYTRDGNLSLSESGALVTNGGYPIVPEINVPRDSAQVSIGPSGIVSVMTPGAADPVEVGRIEVARFLNPNGLLAIGENQYLQTPASGDPIEGLPQDEGFGRVIQGSLESSNVEIVQEMTDMIAAQRAYEINARAIRVGEDMMQATSDLIR
ncbi:MAG: flagellar basal-body rod protein FlgG [Candidatus Eisenbacteria bacterium]|uniref:Flagellar basal-body rod protein FlgG n=1 Tax=Eiseniibacteriota bacterium TaxID=2212470 RepID=A0A849SVX7_UNCEI|nr:flagellar basal-body rod protein FlgG [Candidatus Eisenbacteria bacterium]